MDEFKPDPHFVITDLETLKVIAHSLRAQLLDQFGEGPMTVKQVAGRMGLSPNKLYYHVNMLEEHGLIRVVETRTVGNMIEKVYQDTAERYDIDHELLSFRSDDGQENVTQVLTTTLDAMREDLVRSLEARRYELAQGAEPHPREAMVTRCTSRVPQERVAAFKEQLKALFEEFGDADVDPAEDDTAQGYALTVAFYPTFSFPDQDA